MKKTAHFIALISFFIFHLAIFNSVYAQISHSKEGTLDAQAEAVLKKAAARFDQNVSFSVKMVSLDSKKVQTFTQTANVHYFKGKYRLSASDQELISDGATVWHWNKSQKEVAVNNMGEDDIDLLNPGRLLANYKHSFKAKYIRTEDDGTAVIDMQPRSSRSYHKIRLFVNERSGLLKSMEVHKYDSSREIYTISNFKVERNYPVSNFTFNPASHPDVEVIDMR